MITDLYSVDGWVRTWLNHDHNIIFAKWFNFTSMIHVKGSCEMQLKILEKYKVKTIIADASEAIGIPYPEVQEWFAKTLYPESRKFGLDTLVTILPLNSIAKLGTRDWKNTTNFGINYVEVSSIDEAYKYLKIS